MLTSMVPRSWSGAIGVQYDLVQMGTPAFPVSDSNAGPKWEQQECEDRDKPGHLWADFE